jgi:hypothetical protein
MKNECLRAVTAELDSHRLPYRIDLRGKHIRIRFGTNFELTQIVPASPSDRRAPLNARADVRRAIRNLFIQEASQ